MAQESSRNRMAGQLLLSLFGGTGAAVAADAISHDALDRTAQDYKDWAGDLSSSPEMVQGAYVSILGKGPIPLADRMTVTALLQGDRDLLAGIQQTGQVAMGSKEGVAAAKKALALQQQDPALSAQVGRLAAQENEVFRGEAALGMTPAQMVQAAQEGAGVSPVPALVAGLGTGGLVGAIGVLAGRRPRQG